MASSRGARSTERAFLALCIASPEEGARALASLDLDEHFTSELLRRAAGHLRAGQPLRADGRRGRGGREPGDDPELKALLAELVVQAGRESRRDPAMLEVQRLQLELARLDRRIQRARGAGQRRGERAPSAARRSSASSTRPTSGRWRRRGYGSG